MIKIMFVCTGNTCRSPMAEYILKNLLKRAEITDVKVTSAGLSADPESSISKNAAAALKGMGIIVRRFKPKKVSSELCRKQNAVICMTAQHKKYIVGFKNVYTIDELTGLGEISDPYGGEQAEYDECAKTLALACEKIFELLTK